MAVRVLHFCLCSVTPLLVRALLHKHQEKSLGGAQCSSLNHYVSNELMLRVDGHQSEFGCRDAIADGVDFVTFKKRRRQSPLWKVINGAASVANRLRGAGDSGKSASSESEDVEVESTESRTLAETHQLPKDDIPTSEQKLSDYEYQGTHHVGYESAPVGKVCWEDCSAPGFCEACGSGNACCRQGYDFDPPECHNITEWKDGSHHECVQTEPWLDSEVVDTKDQLVVWVSGYPRSGSSILLSMVSATVDDNMDGGHTFSLFEPCHDKDSYENWLHNKGCRQLLYGVSHCDFKGIDQLWGWKDPHSSNGHTKNFSMTIAQELCQGADIVAFKTVDWGHNLKQWKWLMDTRPNMKVLDVVRDPRAIYASWKKLEPFKSLVENRNFYTIGDICDHFAINLEFDDARVHRVIFEDLMTTPRTVTEKVYEFLGEDFTSEQEDWLSKAFNAAECPEPPPGMEGYTDCHTWTGVDPRGDEAWRTILSEDELRYFTQSEACQRVALAYKYPTK